jgi:Ser/Thr protein kinase RdoA (MazF antagonist)
MGELDAEPDAIGLIHSDLHLGNVLFYDGEARAIDFDDCGFGYWAYDFAAPLVDSWHGEQFDGFRDALLDGYSRVRQVPEGQVGHLDTLIAARIARLALWATARAQAHPSFRQQLDDWWGWASGHFRQFLDTR